MAEEYGFKYELVQYHWPHWLHAQTEKQRIIWGYVFFIRASDLVLSDRYYDPLQ